jgi:hypothetical protein
VSEDRVLRRIFGRNRKELAGGWRRLYDEVKVKLSLCLTKHHAIKAYWGVHIYLHAFFDLGTR